MEGRFQLDTLIALLEGGEITHASLVPTMLQRLLDAWGDRDPPAGFRCFLVGGARTPAQWVHRAEAAGFPVALTYGLSETTSQVATAPPGQAARKPAAVGKPLAGVEIRITKDSEILVRGETLSLGYLDTDHPLTDSAGWFHTGDLGHLDEDGDLCVSGRKNRRIVSGGVTVDAIEVEEILLALPQVREAVVFGLPDPEWGERVVAVVVPESGATTGSQELREALRRSLSGAKVPRQVEIADTLPRNKNGKVILPRLIASLESIADKG
jgi:O-succinylbenzoic acid--CoA ligase